MNSLRTQEVDQDNGGGKGGPVRQQADGQQMLGLFDANGPKIDGEYIKCRFRAALNRGGHPADDGVRAVFLQQLPHITQGRCAGKGLENKQWDNLPW